MENIQTIIRITEDELNTDSLIPLITTSATGAVCTFTGVVRGETIRDTDELNTEYLEYEAYIPMAEAKMEQVAQEIRKKWPAIEGIAIIQRVGRLYPKTPTVVIACASSHRNTGVFEATRYGIDRLKEIVPIWKKEVSQDGETWIEGEYTPNPRE
jgi:molybdopterin synthase catalytic subunit